MRTLAVPVASVAAADLEAVAVAGDQLAHGEVVAVQLEVGGPGPRHLAVDGPQVGVGEGELQGDVLGDVGGTVAGVVGVDVDLVEPRLGRGDDELDGPDVAQGDDLRLQDV